MGFWWEQGSWPVTVKDEIRYHFFEDIRRLIFLLENPAVGNFDLYQHYGKSIDGGITYLAYDEQNWVGSWNGYAAPALAKEGEVTVIYRDHTGTEDIYLNHRQMSEATLDSHPPIKSDGKLDTRYWRLGVNPNYYCHYNQNAGKPDLDADGRYFIIYHAAGDGYLSYVCDLEAHNWLPRHTHPYRQIAPLLRASGAVQQRYSPVEKKDRHITQNLGTQWPRDSAAKYRKLTEYVMELGEPDAVVANQSGHDSKMCEAYQDRAIRTMEHEQRYLTEVDQTYADAWTKRQGTEWAGGINYKDGTTQWAVAASIVYLPGGAVVGTRYLCVKSHLSAGANQPPNTEFWTTPAYRPDLCIYQPEYEPFGARFFCCNGSAYEKVLKNIGQYDWWWDSAYPYVPDALKDLRDAEGAANWPLPCGCWRRTWRHSMGRVGTIMWPGESGEPPEYFPDQWSVTQAVYDTIPGANQHEYSVVNNPPDFTLTAAQEAALKKRHDLKATSTARIGLTTIFEPHYELHHDLVNDIYNALKELHLVEWTYSSKCWNERASILWPDDGAARDTSLAAYANARFHTEKTMGWQDNGWEGGMPEKNFGYRGHIFAVNTPPVEYFSTPEHTFEFGFQLAVCLRVPKANPLPGVLTGRLLLRVAWKGMDCTFMPAEHCYAPAIFGFEDKTFTGVCGHTVYKCEWVGLQPTLVQAEFDATFVYYWFYGYTLSPWPLTSEGSCMDWTWVGPGQDNKYLRSTITMKIPNWTVGITRRSIFDIDWNKISVSVFEELETNFIKVRG